MVERINEINPELKEKLESGEISRGQFLKQLGLSSATLMAFYCMGTLSSCSSKKEDDPTPVNPGTVGGSTKVDITLDLGSNDFKGLKTDGEFVVKDSFIIFNSAGAYFALSKACTHEGTTVSFRKASNDVWCSNHGSVFGTDGSVKTGPATRGLKIFKTEIFDNGNKVRVFE
jgi:cytochrome b6-f complex iron-sulfur subunit